MFALLSTDQFKKIYFQIATDVVNHLGLELSDIVLQTQCTPRIFRPGAHGTSFHSDYWYGHGIMSQTIWIPFTTINAGNTFMICNDKALSEKYRQYICSSNVISMPKDQESKFSPVLPGRGEGFIFNSDVLHGSPLNHSVHTRLSIDFRIGFKKDRTTTKDIHQYFFHDGHSFIRSAHSLENKHVLKYIAGGKNRNTFAQHILIEAISKEFGMVASGQEAEMERYGQPIFQTLISGLAEELNFDAIIIASKYILDDDSVSKAKITSYPVFCALENCFLHAT